jgi:hypothetical protein
MLASADRSDGSSYIGVSSGGCELESGVEDFGRPGRLIALPAGFCGATGGL